MIKKENKLNDFIFTNIFEKEHKHSHQDQIIYFKI